MGNKMNRLIAVATLNRDLMRAMIYIYYTKQFEVDGDNVIYGDLEHVVIVRNKVPIIIRTSEFKIQKVGRK